MGWGVRVRFGAGRSGGKPFRRRTGKGLDWAFFFWFARLSGSGFELGTLREKIEVELEAMVNVGPRFSFCKVETGASATGA